MRNQISEPIELALNKPLPTMWDSVLKAFRDVSNKASDVYLKRPKVRNDREHVGMHTSHIMSVGFNCMDEENTDSLNILQRQCRQDNNPPHESFVESSSRARMSYHNLPKSCLYSIM